MNIPIYRAKKECDGEYIEFKTYFEEDGKYRAIVKWTKEDIQGWLDPVYVPLTFRIDITTLEISDGLKFRKVSECNFRTDYEMDMHSYNGYCNGWNNALKDNGTPPYKIYEMIKSNK